MVVPADTAYTMPEEEPMVATDMLLLVHVPPVPRESRNVTAVPVQAPLGPIICAWLAVLSPNARSASANSFFILFSVFLVKEVDVFSCRRRAFKKAPYSYIDVIFRRNVSI